jgi:hypothetical protein
VHDGHSSAAGHSSIEKQESVLIAMLAACEQFYFSEINDRRSRRTFAQAMGRIYFWQLGYSTYWVNGQFDKAIQAFRNGLRLEPLNLGYWKTYICALIKSFAFNI